MNNLSGDRVFLLFFFLYFSLSYFLLLHFGLLVSKRDACVQCKILDLIAIISRNTHLYCTMSSFLFGYFANVFISIFSFANLLWLWERKYAFINNPNNKYFLAFDSPTANVGQMKHLNSVCIQYIIKYLKTKRYRRYNARNND